MRGIARRLVLLLCAAASGCLAEGLDIDELGRPPGEEIPEWRSTASTAGSTRILFSQDAIPWDEQTFAGIVNAKPWGPGWGGKRIYLNGVETAQEVITNGAAAGEPYVPPVQVTFLNVDASKLDSFEEHFFDASLFEEDTPLHEKLVSVPVGLAADHTRKVTVPRPQAGITSITQTSGVQLNQAEGHNHVGTYYDTRTIGDFFPWQERVNGTQKVVNITYRFNVAHAHDPATTFSPDASRVRVEFYAKNRIFSLSKADSETTTTLSNAFALAFRHKHLEVESINVNGASRMVPLRIQLGLRIMQKRGNFYEKVFSENVGHPHVFHKSPANTSDPQWCNDKHPSKYLTGYGAQTDSVGSDELKHFAFEVSHDQLQSLLVDAGYPDTNPKNYFVEYAAITNETHLYPGDIARNAFSYGGLVIALVE
jgi:hypothetical protein